MKPVGQQLKRGDTFRELEYHAKPPIPNGSRILLRKYWGRWYIATLFGVEYVDPSKDNSRWWVTYKIREPLNKFSKGKSDE